MAQTVVRYMERELTPRGMADGHAYSERIREVYSLLTELMEPGKTYTTGYLVNALGKLDSGLRETVVNSALHQLRRLNSDIVRVRRGVYVYKARSVASAVKRTNEPNALNAARKAENRDTTEADRMMTALVCLNISTLEYLGEDYDGVPDIRRGIDCFAELAARWLGLPDDSMASYRFLVAAESAPLPEDRSYSLSKNLESAEILFQMLLEDGQTGGSDANALNAAFEYLRDFRECCEA